MKDSRKVKDDVCGVMDSDSRRLRPPREWVDDVRDGPGKDVHSLSLEA
jgi:hypothetical protein